MSERSAIVGTEVGAGSPGRFHLWDAIRWKRRFLAWFGAGL